MLRLVALLVLLLISSANCLALTPDPVAELNIAQELGFTLQDTAPRTLTAYSFASIITSPAGIQAAGITAKLQRKTAVRIVTIKSKTTNQSGFVHFRVRNLRPGTYFIEVSGNRSPAVRISRSPIK